MKHFENLEDIDCALNELDEDTFLRLTAAWRRKEPLEYQTRNGSWWPIGEAIALERTLRLKPKPVVPITVPWDAIRPEYRFAAKDASGKVFVCTCRPTLREKNDCWFGVRFMIVIFLPLSSSPSNFLMGVSPGDVFWRDSLIERPKGKG